MVSPSFIHFLLVLTTICPNNLWDVQFWDCTFWVAGWLKSAFYQSSLVQPALLLQVDIGAKMIPVFPLAQFNFHSRQIMCLPLHPCMFIVKYEGDSFFPKTISFLIKISIEIDILIIQFYRALLLFYYSSYLQGNGQQPCVFPASWPHPYSTSARECYEGHDQHSCKEGTEWLGSGKSRQSFAFHSFPNRESLTVYSSWRVSETSTTLHPVFNWM